MTFLRFVFKNISLFFSRYPWLTPVVIFIIWRVGLYLLTIFLAHHSIILPSNWKDEPNPPLLARWDSAWYYEIVHHGYTISTSRYSSLAFFPLYPILWKVLSFLPWWHGFIPGLIVANINAFLFTLVFYAWIVRLRGKKIALFSLLALLFFPTSFFLVSAYSESTFLLLLVLAFLSSEKKQWLLAAFIAGIASAARPVGILLWPTLFLLWLPEGIKRFRWRDFLALGFLPPIGLILFSIYLKYTVGNPLAWLAAQKDWGRTFSYPHNLILSYFKDIFLIHGELWHLHAFELSVLLFILALLPTIWHLRKSYVFFVFLNLAPLLFGNSLLSLQRLALAILPVFAACGGIMAKKPSRLFFYLLVALPLLLINLRKFIIGEWAG